MRGRAKPPLAEPILHEVSAAKVPRGAWAAVLRFCEKKLRTCGREALEG